MEKGLRLEIPEGSQIFLWISIGLHQAHVNFNMFSVKSFTSIISFDFHNNSVK